MNPSPIFDVDGVDCPFIPIEQRGEDQEYAAARERWPNHEIVDVTCVDDPRPVYVPGLPLEDRPS